jgi:hypothetical protein
MDFSLELLKSSVSKPKLSSSNSLAFFIGEIIIPSPQLQLLADPQFDFLPQESIQISTNSYKSGEILIGVNFSQVFKYRMR